MLRLFLVGTIIFSPFFAEASNLADGSFDFIKAKAVEVSTGVTHISDITGFETTTQDVQAEIIEPESRAGTSIYVLNDYVPLRTGQTFYAQEQIDLINGEHVYFLTEPSRMPVLVGLLVIFVLILLLFGGIQGIRGLISLIVSLLLIVFILVPGMLKGFSPVLVSLIVSSFIVVLGSYITHGFNKTTTAAVIGMIIALCFTGLLAYIAVYYGQLSGLSDESAASLKAFSDFNVQGLLLGGMLIGLLGVLYDAAISQAIVIEELIYANPQMTIFQLYKRGIRIGREHIGALVDTLAIAYVGSSLPLLLLAISISKGQPLSFVLNQEIFATEIIRILVGSIGLIIAIPITTYASIIFLKNVKIQHVRKIHTHHHH